MKKIKFSINSYEKLMKLIQESNFEIKGFHDFFKYKRVIILRHDVDFCTASALKIAELENKLNIKSIYFLLVNTRFYNLHAQEHYLNICKILDLGHKIGLHFDASHYKFNELSKNCRREVKVLESLFGFKNDIISFHRPVKQLLSNDKKLAGYDHTYMKKFTQNINYCSDSQGKWLYDTPEKIIKESINKKDFKLQLLIHPIWWNIKNYKTPQKKISSFLRNQYEELKLAAEDNCKPFRKFRYAKNK